MFVTRKGEDQWMGRWSSHKGRINVAFGTYPSAEQAALAANVGLNILTAVGLASVRRPPNEITGLDEATRAKVRPREAPWSMPRVWGVAWASLCEDVGRW